MRKKIDNYIGHKVYKEFIKTGARLEDIADKFGVSKEYVSKTLNGKLKSVYHKKNVERIKKETADQSYLNDLKNGKIDLENVVVPNFEGVELYKTVGAWGDFEKKQYKLLKYIKNF